MQEIGGQEIDHGEAERGGDQKPQRALTKRVGLQDGRMVRPPAVAMRAIRGRFARLSSAACGDEMGGVDQSLGLGAERGERGLRFGDEGRELRLGGLRPEPGD